MGSWIPTPSSSTSEALAERRLTLARRVHRSLLCVLLAGGVLWLGNTALQSHDAFASFECLLALVALGAAAIGLRFTCYPVILLACLLSAEWLLSVWLSFRIGYFAHLTVTAVLQALVPGVLLELVLLYAGLVSVAFYRRGTS